MKKPINCVEWDNTSLMKENSCLVFDEIKYLVTKDNQSVTLNPLSFKLLHTLAQSSQSVVPIKILLTSVWPNNNVSPDTLKQRVFVLRKSLEQSSLNGISIQAVRGEGYRLIVEENETSSASTANSPPLSKTKFESLVNTKKILYAIISLVAVISIAIWVSSVVQSPNNDKAITNNRIALWSNVTPSEMPSEALTIYHLWNSTLSQANTANRLQLILSTQRPDVALPVQARKDRVALISYFEVITINDSTRVKLSLVEPTTATILRTSTLSSLSTSSIEQTLQSQLQGIEALLSSGKLYLNKQQREYAQDPIWRTLKALANPS